MARRLSRFFPLLLLALLLRPGHASARDGSIQVRDSRVDYTFVQQVVFSINVEAPSDVEAITLFFHPVSSEHTTVATLEFTPGPVVTASYTHDLRDRPLPPFGQVAYWWLIEADSTPSLTTEQAFFTYEDNRFEWQTLERAPVQVHWYEGDIVFGQTGLDIASAALARISHELDAPAPDRLDVYIYAETGALQTGLRLTGRTWVGGHADPELGVVLVSVAPGLESRLQMAREIPHELTHVLLYQLVGSEYTAIPNWLNEGLASYYEAFAAPEYVVALTQAAEARELLPLRPLCTAFPTDSSAALLAYAQSESLVRYIRGQFGLSGLAALVGAYADGATCASGVERGLGISLEELENSWQQDVIQASPLRSALRALEPWAAVGAILLLPPGYLLLSALYARARKQNPAPWLARQL